MINYIIINGTNSNTINGLGINELPPISKPSLRTRVETIDGRDGDIITDLGYSAYDKTITIGLFGTGYDINEVISFFNGEGTVVFSNEPDKYYKYKIIEQIDYEALLKFKSASITFHCQPFKYPFEETPIEIEYEYIEQDDVESATMNNTNGGTSLDISLKGNTSQNGTPTPDAPIPINVVSGDNEVVVCGKNKFNSPANQTINFKSGSLRTLTIKDGVFDIGGSAGGTSNNISLGSPYTIQSGDYIHLFNNNVVFNMYLRDSNGDLIAQITPNSSNYIASLENYVGQTITQINFYVNANQGSNTYNFKPMICNSSTATDYEPYQSNSVLLTLGDKEICKIDGYEDKIFKAIKGNEIYDSLSVEEKNTLDYGKWYLRKAIGKVVLDGSENWTLNQTKTYVNQYLSSSSLSDNIATGTSYIMSDYFKYKQADPTDTTNEDYMWVFQKKLVLDIRKTIVVDNTALKTWVETNRPTFYYQLATPTNELFNDNIQDQLEDIYNNMLSYEGQTNVSQVNNDKPFLLDLIAMKKGTDEVVINNIGNTYSKPTIALEGTGETDIYLNDTEILKVDLTDTNTITIDTSNMEAINPTDNTLANRKVIGNYNSMTLPSGNTTMKITGSLTKAIITDYTRWL